MVGQEDKEASAEGLGKVISGGTPSISEAVCLRIEAMEKTQLGPFLDTWQKSG